MTEPGPLEPGGGSVAAPGDTTALFRAILRDSSAPMAATEGDAHEVRYANPAFCRLLGFGDEDAAVIGQPLPAALGVTDLADTLALLDRVYHAGGAASVALFRAGSVQPSMHATYAAWRAPGAPGSPAGLLVHVIDTPDHTQAMRELREVNRRLLQAGLEAEVRAETHVALNAGLRESEQRAQTALRVRDEFLAVAAHELRTPLTTIKATAQMVDRALERGVVDPPRIMRQVGDIVTAAGRLEGLLTDLLDVSRMRDGGLSAKMDTLDLVTLASAVVGRHQRSTSLVTIVWETPTAPVWVQGDAGRLEQVLDNLLSNAVKYSPDGGEVTVRLQRVGDGVLLTVRDRGIGLPSGHEERIFEPFRRAPNAAEHHIPGFGLGLHISRQIADAHGGTLRAQSDGEGAGTTLTLWLPAPQR